MFKGRFVWVEPLAAEHVDGIVAAANPDRSTFEWIDVPTTSDDVHALLADLQGQPEPASSMTFVQRRITDGLIVGMTNFLNIERWNGPDKDPTSVEVGNSWLTPSALASPIDTESKLLLMTHAFEHWNVVRVQVRTDARNDRSRRALIRRRASERSSRGRRPRPRQPTRHSGLFRRRKRMAKRESRARRQGRRRLIQEPRWFRIRGAENQQAVATNCRTDSQQPHR
jgi:N-acetyltransferase